MIENTEFIDTVRDQGVVGAGGAGFPSYVKLQQPVEYFLVNGAECEPLLHKDKELMKAHGDALLEGMGRIRDHLGAGEAILAIKEKYHEIIDFLQGRLPSGMRIHPLGDYYPAGDEFVVVYETLGRVIPRGGLPLHVGAVVMNVETVLNIVWGEPVVDTFMTVGGAVNEPKTVRVPVGISTREVLEACGGVSIDSYAVLSGGVMMGKLVDNLDQPVTKTTGGLLVFPDDHNLIRRYRRDWQAINRIGKSACDQCSFCTELCPRYLLGHPVHPHLAMRALEFSHDPLSLILDADFCCECNICSFIACPEDLDPKNVIVQNKRLLKEKNLKYPEDIPDRPVHGMLDGRRTPVARLFAKLGLKQFRNVGPMVDVAFQPQSVKIPLKQHVGAPASAIVLTGARVRRGDVLGTVEASQLGVPVHASIDGVIEAVTETDVTIRRE